MFKILKPTLIAVLLMSGVFINQSIHAAPTVKGDWSGELSVGTVKLPIVFHITSNDDGRYSAKMDSPSQGALGIPMGETTFVDGHLVISAPNLGIRYEAKLKDNKHIVGIFKQSGQELDLVLTKGKAVKKN